MAEPFLGEIRICSFNFPPKGWAFTNGQLLPINQNQALFSLLGTTFGGNGQTNFGLPDFQGRVPMHVGNGHVLGERGGEQAHTLSISEIPTHTHAVNGIETQGSQATPANNLLAHHAPTNRMSVNAGNATLHPQSLTAIGGSQAHLNMQPFLTLTFCIALQGIFPSPT